MMVNFGKVKGKYFYKTGVAFLSVVIFSLSLLPFWHFHKIDEETECISCCGHSHQNNSYKELQGISYSEPEVNEHHDCPICNMLKNYRGVFTLTQSDEKIETSSEYFYSFYSIPEIEEIFIIYLPRSPPIF